MTADRSADLDLIADGRDLVKERRDLAVIESLDGQLESANIFPVPTRWNSCAAPDSRPAQSTLRRRADPRGKRTAAVEQTGNWKCAACAG
jgi:hypothetical protein